MQKLIQRCLFCNCSVSEKSKEDYKHHLEQIHKLEKHIQETIDETFGSKEIHNDIKALDSFKSLMEDLENIDLNKNFDDLVKGHNPFDDLLEFIDNDKEYPIDIPFLKDIPGESLNKLDYNLKTEETLVKTEPILETPAPKGFPCTECGKSFNAVAKLNIHVKTAHRKNDPKKEKKPQAKVKAAAPTVVPSKPTIGPVKKIESDKAEEELVSGVDNGWSTFLICKCTMCNIRVHADDKSSHLREWHGADGDGQDGGPELTPEPVLYQCLVCIANISWTHDTIEKHLKAHSKSIIDYGDMFREPIQAQIKKQREMLRKEVESIADKKPKEVIKIKEQEQDVEKKVSDSKRVPCKECSESFSTNFSLQRHVKSKHQPALNSTDPDVNQKIPVPISQPQESEQEFACQLCKFKTKRKGAYTFHMKKH